MIVFSLKKKLIKKIALIVCWNIIFITKGDVVYEGDTN